jgi:allophanate hydrolase
MPAIPSRGVPRGEQLDFFGNDEAARLFWAAAERLKTLGCYCVEVDLAPFLAAARLLYEGPWIAERYLAIREFIERRPEALLPTTREIIRAGAGPSAADCFAAYYRLRKLRRAAGSVWEQIDVLLTPTAGSIFTIADVLADPIRLNSKLGTYTNFVNLMDLCAIAVPAGMQRDGLPFGVTLVAPAWADEALCRLADAWHRAVGVGLGASAIPLPPASPEEPSRGDMIPFAVCGAHMSGLPLNAELTERGGVLLRRCRTAPRYRLFALEEFFPPRPGLMRDAAGKAIEVEVWALPLHAFGSFVDSIPSPLGMGTIELEDGETLRGFLCEGYAVARAPEITALGGWRAYLRQGRTA